jgi:hypothetical protein
MKTKMENRARKRRPKLRKAIMSVRLNAKDDESADENESTRGTDDYGDLI